MHLEIMNLYSTILSIINKDDLTYRYKYALLRSVFRQMEMVLEGLEIKRISELASCTEADIKEIVEYNFINVKDYIFL